MADSADPSTALVPVKGGYDDEAKYDDGAGAGAGADAGGYGDPDVGAAAAAAADGGGRGRWGYGGDDADYAAGDGEGDGEDEEDEEDEEEEDLDNEIPAFANEANVALNEEIKAMLSRFEEQDKVSKEHADRLVVMREHMKNVKQELAHTQQLLSSKTSEIKSEDHLKQLAEREIGRIRQETRKVDILADETQDQLNVVQNSIFKGGEKLEQFKVSMNFNQDQLEQWAMAARQKEEDNLALERYTRADERKIKELTLALEKLTTAVTNSKAELEREITETQAKQIELDKTAEEFREIHRQRQDLVIQWQEAIETMQRRDEEIAAASERFADNKERIRTKQEALAHSAHLLKQMEQENKDFEVKIVARQRTVAKQREEFMASQAKLSEFKDEVEVLRNELQKSASEVMASRTRNANAVVQLEAKQQALEVARRRYHACNTKLTKASKESDRVEAVAVRREEELKQEESRLVASERELASIREVMFKHSQELFKLRQEESNTIAEITGAQAASKNLTAKIHKLDQESLRQSELIYSSEFAIQQMERKVSRAQGERSDEEKKQLQAKIAELNVELEQATAQEKMLSQQAKRLQEDLRRTKRRQAQLSEHLGILHSRAVEIDLQNTSAEQSLKQAQSEKEEVMVAHDVLKLEVRKLRNILSGRADEVFGLENRKAQLEMSMEERKKEIAVHMDVQRAQSKLAEEERHKVAMDLKERLTKVNTLRAKFDVISGRMKAEDGDEERSQAYFVIKAAQKREELQREGDELDANIRKCEKETKALVATLKSLNIGNQDYRLSNHKADMHSTEAEQLRKLEAQSKAAADLLFRRKRDLQRVAGEVEEESARYSQLDEQILRTQDHLDSLRDAKAAADAEFADQRKTIHDAEMQLQEIIDEHRGSDPEPTAYELVFRAAATTDTNSNVLFTLGQLAKEFPELQPTLQVSLEERGLTLPARPPSRAPTAM